MHMNAKTIVSLVRSLRLGQFSRSLNSSIALQNQAAIRTHDSEVVKEGGSFVNYRKFPERCVRIETCGNIYEEWRKKKRFRKVPNGDLTFNVRYVDTLHDGTENSPVKEDSPVVLALHGAPGSYNDFGLLASYLWERGIRVIAPCFPDFTVYPPGVFRHSVSEKAQFVKDFLSAINVPGVDTLICHSSAAYPSLRLCFENQMPKINALALLNPGSYTTRMKSTMPFIGLLALTRMCETDLGLQIYQALGRPVLKLIRAPVRLDNLMDPLLSATTMCYADIPKSRELLHDLSRLHFPIFLAFSENDKMVQKEYSYRVAYKLGAVDPQIALINKDGEMVNEGKEVNNIRVLAFENGSHYVFWKYPHIIHEELYSFLKKHVL